jgi:hypothetical protein
MGISDATDNVVSYGTASSSQPVSIDSRSRAYDPTPRTFSRQLLSGNMRGTQNITGAITITDPDTNQQNISIDGSTQAITVTNTDGSVVGMGKLPDGSGDFGFYAQDASGNLLYKIVGSTIYTYDITQSPVVNNMQLLKLPDGTYGMAVAKTGSSVAGLFS